MSFTRHGLHCYQHTELIVSAGYMLYPGYLPHLTDPFSPLGRFGLITSMTRGDLISMNWCQNLSWNPSQGWISESKGMWVLYFTRCVHWEWRCSLALQNPLLWHCHQFANCWLCWDVVSIVMVSLSPRPPVIVATRNMALNFIHTMFSSTVKSLVCKCGIEEVKQLLMIK